MNNSIRTADEFSTKLPVTDLNIAPQRGTDSNLHRYKLIDWRHEFDSEIKHGDIYYDFAKLRHNIIFNHDNIKKELFSIIHNDNDEILVDLKCNYVLVNQLEDFDKFILENNYNLHKIKIITAIIWLNMSPLYEKQLSEFLFYFGKYNLQLLLQKS